MKNSHLSVDEEGKEAVDIRRQNTGTAFISVFVNKARSQLHSRKKETANHRSNSLEKCRKT